ncbi:unnamed protein product [Angiostrongylus costaricensis]|uniref:protein-histidine N-methyltransferase n=1 Tax=Angiostrongylus costaricensis TaxID=334426 RepID=A0A0R3PJG2_ANGCS|nr:unnamed protein product [Angiostrongylus costaricensis]
MDFSSADVNKLKGEFLQTAADLFESVLSKPPTHNIVDLWKEHQHIRKTLEEISTKQALLGDTDVRLLKPRSSDDLACFLRWADGMGIKRYGVTVAECREVGGLGLLAEIDVPEKECCLTVPRHAIISTDLAKKSSLKNLFERDSIVRNMANVGLALFICTQRVKSDSKWTSYLNVLPNVYTTPLFYTEEELQYLKPSPVFEEALLFYRTVARQFIYYLLLIGRNDLYDRASRNRKARTQPPLMYSSPFTVVNFTFSLYRWSVGTVTTRINLIPSETTRADGTVPALIPMLDMANHEVVLGSDDLGDAVSFSTENDYAEVLASKDIRAGEWVSMFYGRRSCAEHLLHNGFVPPDDNPFDSYKLKISKCGFLATSEPTTLRKAVDFLKNRFAILERAYGTIAEGRTSNETNMERLKKAEVAILKNAR